MNTEPKRNETGSVRQALRQAPARILRVCLHNWGWKLLSLFLAVCLWAGLITQDPTLTRERVFNDVPVTVTGTDTLIGNGLIVVSGLEDENLSVRLRADVPQRSYSNAQASNYNPRVDVSRITETGEQTLRTQTSSTTTYGTVTSVSPESLTVVVDEYVTNYRVPITLNVTGSAPDGYYASTPQLAPSTAAVSGPRTIVDQISSIVADYDLSRLSAKEGQVRSALSMRVLDADGNELDGSLLRVTNAGVTLRTVTVEQNLYPTKTLTVSDLVRLEGEPAAGYEVKSVTITPVTVLAAGDGTALDTLDTLFTTSAIDLDDRSEGFATELSLRKPSTVNYLSTDTVTVQVEIEPIITTQSFSGVKLSVRNIPEGLSAGLAQRTIDVDVTGPQNAVSRLSTAKMSAYVDASGLTVGEYALPVMLVLDADDPDTLTWTATPSKASVTLLTK